MTISSTERAFADKWAQVDWKTLAEKDPAEYARLDQERQKDQALLAAVPFASYGTREGYQLSTATFLANERLEQVRNARWQSEPRPVDELGVSPAPTSARRRDSRAGRIWLHT